MSLSIGIATHNDFDGLWMSLQALHAYHPTVEYLVVDYAPVSCQRSMGVTRAVGGRYLHRPDLHGTSASRDALFRLARTDWVMCLDAHVLLEPGAVEGLLQYVHDHPNCRNLLTGPMVHDDGRTVSTHWNQLEPPGLWGEPARDERCRGTVPFEIPMQELGLFAMRRSAWPGFHPLCRHAGGEEGYLHEKVRRHGGVCVCLPQLRWRRRLGAGTPDALASPDPLRVADYAWNLLVQHRELGVDAVEQIREHCGARMDATSFSRLVAESDVQPFGEPVGRKRLKLLGVWYSDNSAPQSLLSNSLGTIQRAQQETMFHDVTIATSSWEPIAGNPFLSSVGRPQPGGHAAILEQIRSAIGVAVKGDARFDGLVFLEHDVLYPPGHFDRMGNALGLGAPVVSNLDYEGLNATGWLAVRARHEPMHQLGMSWDVAMAHLARVDKDCKQHGWAYLEPQGDRSAWTRLSATGLTPAIHVNHPRRFTMHGEVAFFPHSAGRIEHPFWGHADRWWPGQLEASPRQGQGNCSRCGQPTVPLGPVWA